MKVQKISVVAVLIVPFAVLLIFFFNTRGSRVNNVQVPIITIPDSDTAFAGIFFRPTYSENDTSSQHKKIEKDFLERKEKMKIINEGELLHGLSFGFIGVQNFPLGTDSMEITYKQKDTDRIILISKKMEGIIDSIKKNTDTIKNVNYTKIYDSLRNEYDKNEMDIYQTEYKVMGYNHYFSLSGYEFKENETKFFIDKGTYNLAYVKWVNENKTDSQRVGMYLTKKIDIRYSSANKRILIPITESRHIQLKTILMATIFLLIGIAMYFFLGLPFQILLNISRGKAFCLGNIKYLNQMIFAACIFYTLVFLSPYLFQLIFIDKIPTEIFYSSFSKTLGRNFFSLFLISILFLIKKAFEKGYNLQEENALTV
jgi:Protein of unknown function (DUF2975)